jgi:uncharacterized tellurite resistance protein B-like protein
MRTDHRLDYLAALYVGLAHGLDGRMHFNEFTQIADHLVRWRHPGDQREVLELVDAAVRGHSPDAVIDAVSQLGRMLSPREKSAVLEDLSEIALADRRFLKIEADYIGQVATSWNVHPAHDERGAFWTVLRARTLSDSHRTIAELVLVYLSVAYQPDHEIVPEELEAISRRVAGWIPDAPVPVIRMLVSQALARYAEGLSASDFDAMLPRISAAVPGHQRVVIVSDLKQIARADGEMSVEERVWIDRLERGLGDGS